MESGSLESGIFFVPTAGLVSTAKPYEILGLAETAPHAVIVEALVGAQDRPEAAMAAFVARPACRLAWHLLRPPATTPNARQFARAVWDFHDSRACAAYLLAAAISRELQGPHDTGLDELWSEAEARWRAIAKHRDAPAWLSALAAQLGIDETETVVRAVLSAIQEELLPGLRALFSVASQNEKRQHEHCRLGAVLQPSNAPIVRLCARQWQRATLESVRKAASSGKLDEAIRELLSMQVPTGMAKAQLAAEAADLLELKCGKVNSLSQPCARACIALVGEVADQLPYDVRVFRMLSALNVRIAVLRIEEEDFYIAGIALAKAAVMDPTNDTMSPLLQFLRERLSSPEADPSPTESGQLLSSHEYAVPTLSRARVLCEIETFAVSEEGQLLHERRRQVLHATIAARLGLDPCNDEHMSAVAALAGAIDEGTALDDVSTIQALITAHPVLAGLSWFAIGAARAATDSLGDFALALLPPHRIEIPPEEAEAIKAMYDHMASAANTGSAAQEKLAQTVYPWVFSPANLRAKCAAAVGIVLFAFGLAVLGSCAWHAECRDAASGDTRDAQLLLQDAPEVICREAERNGVHPGAQRVTALRAFPWLRMCPGP